MPLTPEQRRADRELCMQAFAPEWDDPHDWVLDAPERWLAALDALDAVEADLAKARGALVILRAYQREDGPPEVTDEILKALDAAKRREPILLDATHAEFADRMADMSRKLEAAEARALRAEAACAAMRLFAAEWLRRAYDALTREGWEPGMATEEVRDAICSVLANLDADPCKTPAPPERPARYFVPDDPGAPLLDALRLAQAFIDSAMCKGRCAVWRWESNYVARETGAPCDCGKHAALAAIRKVLP